MKRHFLTLYFLTLGGLLVWGCLSGPALAEPQPAKQTFSNRLDMHFVSIPAGALRFGYTPPPAQSPETPSALFAADPDYPVWISRAYGLQTTEVTQGQWQAVMGSSQSQVCQQNFPAPSPVCQHLMLGPDYPLTAVTVKQVEAFLEKLSQREGQRYRLPTRPEWEQAARAGSWQSRYWWGDSPQPLPQSDNCQAAGDSLPQWLGWLQPEARDGFQGLAPVAQFRPNPWGLYDMQGNVSELLAHPSELWQGYRLDPSQHFVNDPSDYLQAYQDFPTVLAVTSPYRDVAGGNYLRQAAACGLSAGSGLLEQAGAAPQAGQLASPVVGFRVLLEHPVH